jgi:hypothetical protein
MSFSERARRACPGINALSLIEPSARPDCHRSGKNVVGMNKARIGGLLGGRFDERV